jgi:ATP-dependent Lon protease
MVNIDNRNKIKFSSSKNVVISSTNMGDNFKRKINYLRHVVQRTIVNIQHFKANNIISSNNLKVCLNLLHKSFVSIDTIEKKLQSEYSSNTIISSLQKISSDISSIFRSYGTESLRDLLSICLGADYVDNLNKCSDELFSEKLGLLLKYAHPINYKIYQWKTDQNDNYIKKNKIVDDEMIVQSADSCECFDLARTSNNYRIKVYGIKISFHDTINKKTMIVSAVIDDVMLECIESSYITSRMITIQEKCPSNKDTDCYLRFIKSLVIKDLVVYNDEELLHRFIGYKNQVLLIKKKPISQVITEFIGCELFQQRTTLLQVLLKANEPEYQYLAYLLYDLLTSDTNGSVDTYEQTILFDSLPWNIKQYFRDAMKQTIKYTNNLTNMDNAKIPLEQQICLMKASDSVKEKAMLKLKEVKAKSEDSGSKARQYLEGLLKIPFGVYRDEPILGVMNHSITKFNELVKSICDSGFPLSCFPIKNNYNSLEMRKYCDTLENNYMNEANEVFSKKIINNIVNQKRNILISHICKINSFIKSSSIKYPRICHSGKKRAYMQKSILDFFDKNNSSNIIKTVSKMCNIDNSQCDIIPLINNTLSEIHTNSNSIYSYIEDVNKVLDSAVHGHTKAKRQVERIIGQWMNGEKSGYCFGFEGPPGVGKTSLAKKGIAKCLKDNDNCSRPFAFIAVGGSSNGSTLDGHNYTYVGSTWGKIVDILIETKCMNPIIFIDELDKVSRTEHGKEIIGILTHLIDPTQNDTFQDKYFTGIDIDLSKALFIFSYNDVDAIDRILLDRIHRVKFDALSMKDKLIITRNYLFKEIYSKMGLNDVIDISDEVIQFIIEQYTQEPGVRKLKELLFEIVGEINIDILKKTNEFSIPIVVTKDDIKSKYLKDRHEVKPKEIHSNSQIGLISGLWANSLGQGGVLPIEASYYPCGTMFDLKLTGMQGDVMKESMMMAKTLAWRLATNKYKKLTKDWIKNSESTKLQGIHIHVPEGATPKDGPSAGTAITVAMYSLFTNKRIKHDVAITGEMSLQGRVTAIGGLPLKILGGIRAGVKTFIFPSENKKDFEDFLEKYKNKPEIKNIEFLQVDTIEDVLNVVFESD